MRLEKWPMINRPLQLDKGNNGRGQRKVRSFWSNGFSGSILLPDKTLRPGRKLQGKVVIHSKALVTFSGLRVQLDAQCTLFLEKNGELVTKRFSIMQTDLMTNNAQNLNSNNARRNNATGSSIHCDAVESLANSKEIYALIPDINSIVDATTFPFSLEIPGERNFPAPFNSTVGSLVFKISAHLCSQDLRFVSIAEETLEFKGYCNLSNNQMETNKPIFMDRPLPLQQSHRGSNGHVIDGIGATFQVESSGFLPEEAVHFTLRIRNPKRESLHMRVFIAQKISYSIAENCWKKVTSTVVRCERVEVNIVGDGSVVWKGALIIPKGLVPSFLQTNSANCHPGYSVLYSIQVVVCP
ncbi:hypothetical protein Ocin01_01580 [Orchesella cincta]|uniref:Arrestin C-terminal-like domain-containing protein n=1 Tax=Orchesella cincta TaxID=48709 RepID=A0A1D2NIJ2_ORCCI|nr:hypothetical protein Ocin01_01580 [Orchesella cincta]